MLAQSLLANRLAEAAAEKAAAEKAAAEKAKNAAKETGERCDCAHLHIPPGVYSIFLCNGQFMAISLMRGSI